MVMKVRRVLFPVYLILACLLQQPADAAELLLTNAHIVDPKARKVRNGALYIRDGVIVATPLRAPRDFAGQIVDLKGKWIIPGLNDMHTHSFGNQPFSAQDTPGTPGVAVRVLAVGVTGLLDLFGDENGLDQVRAQQRAGALGGADLFTSLSCLTAPKGHCTEYGIPTRTMSTPEQARSVVGELALKHPDVIKIVYQPSGPMPSVDKATLAAAVTEARRNGIKTILHIDTWGEVSDAIDVGATAVTHIPDDPLPDALARRMAKSGIIWVPTITVEIDAINFASDPKVLDTVMAREITKPGVIAAYRNEKYLAKVRADRGADEAHSAVALANVKKAADAGVRILTGTDAGNWGTLQGYSVHREMVLMVQAGLSPWQALGSATSDAGDFLGRHFGVNIGDQANLVVLDASPIANIANTQAINMVIHHGKIVDRQALLASPVAGLAAPPAKTP
jgi:imidazolonepropionase-like amidohydrolase